MHNDRSNRPSIPPRRGVFDVVRPGQTPASPTSRPVVNNQRPVQDTSITVGAPAVPRGLMDMTQPKPAVPSQPAPSPAPAPMKPATPMHQPVSRPTFGNHSRPMQYRTQPLQAQQEVGEAAVEGQVTKPEGVDEAPMHELPAHAGHGRHSMLSEVLAILAIVFLIAVIVNILVDADVIDLPIPHTNFFDY